MTTTTTTPRDKILAALTTRPQTVAQFAQTAGIPLVNASAILNRLVEDGLAARFLDYDDVFTLPLLLTHDDDNGEPANRFTALVDEWHEYGPWQYISDGPDAEATARAWNLDPAKRYLLVRTCNDGKTAELSSWDTDQAAADYHDSNRSDWEVVLLADLHTGGDLYASTKTTWVRHKPCQH